MTVLRKMTPEEYPAYCEYFIDDYSQEIAVNYGYSMEVAIELAKIEVHGRFASKAHSLLCIEAVVEDIPVIVGYLWHSINAPNHSTYIFDFYISENYRDQGFGRKAIALLEEQLLLMDINEIKLRVAYNNNRAFKLYKEMGFSNTGNNMSKRLA